MGYPKHRRLLVPPEQETKRYDLMTAMKGGTCAIKIQLLKASNVSYCQNSHKGVALFPKRLGFVRRR